MPALTPTEADLLRRATNNGWIPHKPTDKQLEFLLLTCREALYGGAAGGGKSEALLMAALQYVDVPGYNALLLRRTYADLALPGALMDRAGDWLAPTGARWNGTDKKWTFPSGASLTFGYLENENQKYRYQGAEFQGIFFDELTQFQESQYRYLFSRLRKLAGVDIPLRMRGASNPGGVGHAWVRRRFLDEGPAKGRQFVPATLDDNPHLDTAEYEASLEELGTIEKLQLRYGDWDVKVAGSKFRREWFEVVDPGEVPPFVAQVRFWDLAATEPEPGKDPDWTSGTHMGVTEAGIYYITNVTRFQQTPYRVEQIIRSTALRDGYRVPVFIEQEPGSSGKTVVSHYRRNVLPDFTFYGKPSTGSKEVRANPYSGQAEKGNVKLVRGAWVTEFLDEHEIFPHGEHDDQVDSTSGAYEVLSRLFARSRQKAQSRQG